MVYSLQSKNITEMDLRDSDPVDGNLDLVSAIDMTQDDGVGIVKGAHLMGRALGRENMPTKMRIAGRKFKIPDLFALQGNMVSSAICDVFERIEPGVHQFFPISLYWRNGELAADRFWINVCNRIDSIDKTRSTVPFKGIWKTYRGGELVFNKSQIGERHAWIEKLLSGGSSIWISDVLGDALKEKNLTGLVLTHHREV